MKYLLKIWLKIKEEKREQVLALREVSSKIMVMEEKDEEYSSEEREALFDGRARLEEQALEFAFLMEEEAELVYREEEEQNAEMRRREEEATPAPIGSANNGMTCGDCLCSYKVAYQCFCSQTTPHGTFSRKAIVPDWEACSEFRVESEFALLKNFVAERLKPITKNGDFWYGKNISVIIDGDHVVIKDRKTSLELESLTDEEQAIALIRSLE